MIQNSIVNGPLQDAGGRFLTRRVASLLALDAAQKLRVLMGDVELGVLEL